VEALQLLQPQPLAQLLFLGQDQLHAEGESASMRAGMAYAQSWAFVHYLIFGLRAGPKDALMAYVSRLRTETHPDEAFRQAFGGTYAEVDRKLREYIRGGRYYVAKQPVASLPALKAEPASVVEIEDALARLRMVGGRHEEAKINVERAVAAAPEDPRVYELQGELAQELGDAAAAQAAYRTAVEKGSRDFRPYFELASAEHQAASESGGNGVELAPETARRIANRYEQAINLHPRFRPAYQGLASVVNLVPAGNPEDEGFLEQGLKLFPHDGLIRLGVAVVAKRAGNDEKAREHLARVLNAAGQPSHVVGYARALETEWMQRDVFGRVDALASQRKFAEALAIVDQRLGEGVDFSTRQRLKIMRDNLQTSHLLEQGNAAIAEQRWDDAQEKFQAVLESNASPILKGQVRRYLEQMEKRGIGKKRTSAQE
jgi:tetratricopeptide (TPR) repeat protein